MITEQDKADKAFAYVIIDKYLFAVIDTSVDGDGVPDFA